jgi:hypothetical protein
MTDRREQILHHIQRGDRLMARGFRLRKFTDLVSWWPLPLLALGLLDQRWLWLGIGLLAAFLILRFTGVMLTLAAQRHWRLAARMMERYGLVVRA